MKTIITTGKVFADIDALACGIAYKELLEKLGKKSEFAITGPLNNTVTKSIKSWNLDYKNKLGSGDTNFVIVDASNKNILPEFVKLNKIIEIYDHRFGYQDFWKDKKIKVRIDEVGACATLIWEEYKRYNLETGISKVSANLLYTAIFSNTLNFNASVATTRDQEAFQELKKYVSLPSDWVDIYYKESEEQTKDNPELAIRNDTKVVDFPEKNIKITIGQIELWNSYEFINDNKEVIKKTLLDFGNSEWFMTAPSISEGKNYIYTESQNIKDNLGKLIDANFEKDLGVTKKLWLRKEILKKMLQ
jgi:inorganic pyrophosphatase/exopolyphosphatase